MESKPENPHFTAMRTPIVLGNAGAMTEDVKNKIAELMALMNDIDPPPVVAPTTETEKKSD